MKTEYYVLVQRRKSLKYGEKQHYQDYITIPAELSRFLGLQPGQVMKCVVNGRGILTYIKAEKKPKNRMTYDDWIRELTPWMTENGKTYRQICEEANILLKSAPALWVKQAERDIGLIRKRDSKTHRMLWTKTLVTENLRKKFRDVTLKAFDMPYAG
jgi:bifunctional DNA-binding transcriptional regulator/antitoxin component of YhaV-PrlF toxin-antitoxin module